MEDVIHVKIGSAMELARILDEIYNGSGTTRMNRIVVFAIPLTNCLFARASRNDLAAIRELVKPF
jgi:hypothetical protein